MKKYSLTIKISKTNIKTYEFKSLTIEKAFDWAMEIIEELKGRNTLKAIYDFFGNDLMDCLSEIKTCPMDLNSNIQLRMIK